MDQPNSKLKAAISSQAVSSHRNWTLRWRYKKSQTLWTFQ